MIKSSLITSIFLLLPNISFAETIYATTFEIRTTVQDKCLDVHGYNATKRSNVGIYHCQNMQDQRWYLADPYTGEPLRPTGHPFFGGSNINYFEIRNAKSGLCLDIEGYDGRPGESATVFDCQGRFDQYWEFFDITFPQAMHTAPMVGDTFRLRNLQQQPKYNRPYTCLDVAGSSGAAGNNVQLWRCDDYNNNTIDDQIWVMRNVYSEVLSHN